MKAIFPSPQNNPLNSGDNQRPGCWTTNLTTTRQKGRPDCGIAVWNGTEGVRGGSGSPFLLARQPPFVNAGVDPMALAVELLRVGRSPILALL